MLSAMASTVSYTTALTPGALQSSRGAPTRRQACSFGKDERVPMAGVWHGELEADAG